MGIERDHATVPSRDPAASAERLARWLGVDAAGTAWRSNVRGPVDHRVNTDHGGRMLYWNEPDRHQWEMLTVSCARPAR